MSRLAAVPESPPRAVGLVRVSKEKDEGVSPELQRTAIEDHCARRGFTITEWIEGIDESGSRRRSPWWARLDQAVELVERHEADVLVVWRFSRTARQRLRWAVAVDRVEVAGGAVESATEPLDTSTASGRLARGMLAEMAAYEAEVIGNTWREVHARRTSRGLPANGKPRFGYRYVDGIHRPDPDTGPVLAELYRRYVAGESMFALAAWLNRVGVTTVPGYSAKGPGPWSQPGLRNMLDAGFGAGFITVRGSRERGIHEPVIDSATWTAYQAARAARRTLRRSERSQYLLSAMVWCGCGSKMGYGRYGRARKAQLRCLLSTSPSAPSHPAGYVRAEPVEQAVRDWVQRHAAPLEQSTDVVLAEAARATRRRHDATALARQVIDVDKAIGRLTADRARGLVPETAYRLALDELAGDREKLEQRRLAAAAEANSAEPAQLAADLVANWDLYGTEELRGGLRQLIDRVIVTGSDVRVVPR